MKTEEIMGRIKRIMEETATFCANCGEKIAFNGDYWVHLDSAPRHPAIPVSSPRSSAE